MVPRRVRRLLFVVVLGLPSGGAGAVASAALDPAPAEASQDLVVGMELVALEDVRLHRAEVGKGSRVTIARVTRARGKTASVDVELADGVVVPRVAVARIFDSFRIVDRDAED
jgi:hypothetical protein